MNYPPKFEEFIHNATSAELDDMLEHIKLELRKRQPTPEDLVKYIPDYCDDAELQNTVWEECESLTMDSSRSCKASTKWLSPKSDPYIYPDTNPIHKAYNIDNYPGIKKLMSFVDASDLVDGPLDSCLVIKYNSTQASLSMHADNEPMIDQDKSICSYSLGYPRTLEFYTIGNRLKKALEFKTQNNGLLVMKPGTQQQLKHCVRPEPGDTNKSGVRYCLSFRALSTKPAAPNVLLPPATKPESTLDNTTTNVSSKHHVCLVAGDSFAARLDSVKLGKSRVEVVNIAKGGSKISHVQKQLEDYISANGDDVIVDKIIISVGTNDIRYCKSGVDHLKGPLKKLTELVQSLYPTSKVYFQSLIPLPLKFPNDFITVENVLNMNRLLFNICMYRRCHYIDVFESFLAPPLWDCPRLRSNTLFDASDIHPNTRGLGVLARHYIFALHSKYFNPQVFQ